MNKHSVAKIKFSCTVCINTFICELFDEQINVICSFSSASYTVNNKLIFLVQFLRSFSQYYYPSYFVIVLNAPFSVKRIIYFENWVFFRNFFDLIFNFDFIFLYFFLFLHNLLNDISHMYTRLLPNTYLPECV